MRIAILGIRGVPANYGGFETCAEQLGTRLVQRGHHVTVYCRSHFIRHPEATYKGMSLIKLPTVPNKYLDTIVHTWVASLHSLVRQYDIVLYFNVGNSPLTWIPRLVGSKTILNVDGLDWKREKWPAWAKRYIQWSEYLAIKLPNLYLTDSQVVQTYYRQRYGHEPPCIAYGSEVDYVPPGDTLARFGLNPQQYILFVGRLVPESYAHHLVDAFKALDTDLKCVLVGDAPYVDRYITWLKAKAQDDPRIIFTGYVFGRGYHELGSNSTIFVETAGAGGTHPALLEAMRFGSCVVVNNTLENLETLGDTGLSYEGSVGAPALKRVLQQLIANPTVMKQYGEKARHRACQVYSWESITDAYEKLMQALLEAH
ncbi:MAG: DUF1972 domain-containing protein [Anaerolineae bacterium]|nr:DUF1972 domain-containing protein [Anaerolineae bacterium]